MLLLVNLLPLLELPPRSSGPSVCLWRTREGGTICFKLDTQVLENGLHLVLHIFCRTAQRNRKLRFRPVFFQAASLILAKLIHQYTPWPVTSYIIGIHTTRADPNDQAIPQRFVLPWQNSVTT